MVILEDYWKVPTESDRNCLSPLIGGENAG